MRLMLPRYRPNILELEKITNGCVSIQKTFLLQLKTGIQKSLFTNPTSDITDGQGN